MKTAGRENPDRGVAWPRNRAHGAVGQNRSRSRSGLRSKKNSSRRRGVFFLHSPFIALATPAGWLYWPETPAESLCHSDNELADVLGQSRTTGLRLPAPEKLETLAMPADESLEFDDHQGVLPIEQSTPETERETGGVVQSSRLDLPLLIKG